MTVAGVILCGGRSSRMRRPKALLPWQGRPLIAHMVACLGEILNEVVVVSRDDLQLPELPARVVVDRVPDLGPLGGIREGLHAIDAELGFITSTDSPHVDASFVRALGEHGRTAACELDGHTQPFPAMYAKALAGTADALIDAGKSRALDLLEAGHFQWIDGSSWAASGVFEQLNTPAQYIAAAKHDNARKSVMLELSGTSRVAGGRAQVKTDAGTLREVLGALEPDLIACPNGTLAPQLRFLHNGQTVIDDLEFPIGPGERVVIVEAGTRD